MIDNPVLAYPESVRAAWYKVGFSSENRVPLLAFYDGQHRASIQKERLQESMDLDVVKSLLRGDSNDNLDNSTAKDKKLACDLISPTSVGIQALVMIYFHRIFPSQ